MRRLAAPVTLLAAGGAAGAALRAVMHVAGIALVRAATAFCEEARATADESLHLPAALRAGGQLGIRDPLLVLELATALTAV